MSIEKIGCETIVTSYIVYEQYTHKMKGVFDNEQAARKLVEESDLSLKVMVDKKQFDKSLPIFW